MPRQRRAFLKAIVLALTPLWLDPLAWRLAFASNWFVSCIGLFLAFLELLLMSVLLASFIAIPICCVGLCFRQQRFVTLKCLVWFVVFDASFFGGFLLGHGVRQAQLHRVIERGQPVVDAIEVYHAKNGRPPASLEDLVPTFIERIPETGIGMWPEFQYVVGQQSRYDQNEWVLIVTPPCVAGFDKFFYFPQQNYPEKGYGGGIERIGTWGYVHE